MAGRIGRLYSPDPDMGQGKFKVWTKDFSGDRKYDVAVTNDWEFYRPQGI